MDQIAVLIPCRNESQSIAKLVRDISATPEMVRLPLDNVRQKDCRDFEFKLQQVHDQYAGWRNGL